MRAGRRHPVPTAFYLPLSGPDLPAGFRGCSARETFLGQMCASAWFPHPEHLAWASGTPEKKSRPKQDKLKNLSRYK